MKKKNKMHFAKSDRNGADAEHKEHKSKDKDHKSAQWKTISRTRIDIDEKTRGKVCQILNQTLADSLDTYSQTKQAHWNVKGLTFYQLHLLFDEIASDLIEYVDLVAERITALGGTAFGTVRMAADATELPEYSVGNLAGIDHVVAMADRLARYGEGLRANIDATDDLGDKDTADIYTEISREIDKWLWFLEAHLQGPAAEQETKKLALEASARQ